MGLTPADRELEPGGASEAQPPTSLSSNVAAGSAGATSSSTIAVPTSEPMSVSNEGVKRKAEEPLMPEQADAAMVSALVVQVNGLDICKLPDILPAFWGIELSFDSDSDMNICALTSDGNSTEDTWTMHVMPDDTPVYGTKSGELLDPVLVRAGRERELGLMSDHNMYSVV